MLVEFFGLLFLFLLLLEVIFGELALILGLLANKETFLSVSFDSDLVLGHLDGLVDIKFVDLN